MTHAELQIAALMKHTEPYGPENQGLKVLKALQAVMELHKPFVYEQTKMAICTMCYEPIEYSDEYLKTDYPCPTIKAIEKELQ